MGAASLPLRLQKRGGIPSPAATSVVGGELGTVLPWCWSLSEAGGGVLEMELGDGLGSKCWRRGVRRAQSRNKHGRLCWGLLARQCRQQKGQVGSIPTS